MFSYLIVIYILCNVQVLGSNATLENVTSITSGNDLWFGLARDCKEPTVSCIKNTIYDYLRDIFDYDSDVNFTRFMKFSKNDVTYKTVQNKTSTGDISIENETPLEEVSRSLRDNSKKFFMTHDLELQLPQLFFLSSTLKVSPRSLDINGTILRLELIPKDLKPYAGEGRIFGDLIGKIIKKYIGDRLLYALLAILLVIKLLAVNVLFFLPSMLGIVTAKKLIAKVLLFLFPALHHLFKLCEYTPYGAKHHIHKHQIAHIHQVTPGHYHHQKPHVEVSESHYDDHSHSHHDGYHDDHHDVGGHYSGFAHKDDPQYGDDDSHPAAAYENEVYHKDPDENEIDSWSHSSRRPKPNPKKHLTETEIENMVLKAEKEALIKSRLQKERLRIHDENLKLQEQLNNALKIQQKLKHHAAIVSSKIKPGKLKPHHLLTPLIPPPLPSASHKYQHSQFAETPSYLPDMSPANPHAADSEPGEFAEPPANYPGPSTKFVGPSANYLESPKPTKVSEIPSGTIGAGLPGDTVHAVQNFLSQKAVQKQHHLRPVYPTSYIENFVGPEQPVQEKSKVSSVYMPDQSIASTQIESNRKSDQLSPEEEFYQAASITYDAFYSPILAKVDGVLNLLQFKEEPCRERLICSMYKNPEKFSPHSNLVSVELSRDTKELKKPISANSAVIRFYKYVQAARDGQDQRDCIRLYPTCAINTEA